MTDNNKLRVLAFQKVYEDENLCCTAVKKQVLNYMYEADEHDVKAYLLDGDLDIVEEDAKSIIDERFEKSELREELESLEEMEVVQEVDPVTVLGLTILGTVVGKAAITAIANKVSKCFRSCGDIKVDEKRKVCLLRCKVEGRNEKLKKLKGANCSKTKNPDKCQQKVKKAVKKEEKKIAEMEERLKHRTQT